MKDKTKVRRKNESAISERKPVTKRERVENFVNAIWDDPKEWTIAMIVRRFRYSSSYVGRLKRVREYRQQKRFKSQSANERTKKLLVKGKCTAVEVAKQLGLSANTITKLPAWQDKQNEIRLAKGKAILEYSIPSKIPSSKIEKDVKKCIADLVKAGEKVTQKKVAEDTGHSQGTVNSTKSWRKHHEPLKKEAEKTIASVLFDKNGNPNLNPKTGKKFSSSEVAAIVCVCKATVLNSKIFEGYLQHFERAKTGERIKRLLAKDPKGKKKYTAQQIADIEECAKSTVIYHEDWKPYRDKIKVLYPTAQERAVRALEELEAKGAKNPMQKLVAKKSKVSPSTLRYLDCWENRHQRFPQLFPSVSVESPPAGSPPIIVDECMQAPIEESTEMYHVAKTDRSEPYETALVEIDPAAQKAMTLSHYEAVLLAKYANEIDEWHIISKTKYNWVGWADIVNAEETERIRQGQKPRTAKQLANRAEIVRRSVETHRKNLGIERND